MDFSLAQQTDLFTESVKLIRHGFDTDPYAYFYVM